MNIAIVGSDHVGLVSAACFAELGNTITCYEADEARAKALASGSIDIKEPGLDVSIRESVQAGRLQFKSDLTTSLDKAEVCFLATGKLEEMDGESDTGSILSLARQVAEALTGDCLIVVMSTVPVGTTDQVAEQVSQVLASAGKTFKVEVASNPEFMRQGRSMEDFLNPDRIIVGVNSTTARQQIAEIYQSFTRNRDKMLFMGVRDAEMTKYAASAMLATRISLMNELANIAELVGADIEQVREGIGSDSRIGFSFIYPGSGYGGASFTQNVRNLIQVSENNDFQPTLLRAVDSRNKDQKQRLLTKTLTRLNGSPEGSTVAVWGLAFRPGVFDITESSAIFLIDGLLKAGVKVRAYDPVCNDLAREYFGDQAIANGALTLADHQYDALVGADALVLATEWKPFRQPDFYAMKNLLNKAVVIDGRNQYDPATLVEQGFDYTGMGRTLAAK